MVETFCFVWCWFSRIIVWIFAAGVVLRKFVTIMRPTGSVTLRSKTFLTMISLNLFTMNDINWFCFYRTFCYASHATFAGTLHCTESVFRILGFQERSSHRNLLETSHRYLAAATKAVNSCLKLLSHF